MNAVERLQQIQQQMLDLVAEVQQIAESEGQGDYWEIALTSKLTTKLTQGGGDYEITLQDLIAAVKLGATLTNVREMEKEIFLARKSNENLSL